MEITQQYQSQYRRILLNLRDYFIISLYYMSHLTMAYNGDNNRAPPLGGGVLADFRVGRK